MRLLLICALLAAATAASVTFPGYARADDYCATYSATAVAEAQEVRDLGCMGHPGFNQDSQFPGFNPKDPRWSTDPNVHQRWCKSADRDSVINEETNYVTGRRALVQRCEACVVYANKAVAAAKENQSLKCGFSGPNWSTNWNTHLDWCLQLTPEQIGGFLGLGNVGVDVDSTLDQETGARDRQIAECEMTHPVGEVTTGAAALTVHKPPTVPLNIHSPTYHGPKTKFTPQVSRHVLPPCYPGGPPRLPGQFCPTRGSSSSTGNSGGNGPRSNGSLPCPRGTSGTPPNCKPGAVSTPPKCPLGTYGTPPNCKKVAVGVKLCPGGTCPPVIH